MQSLSANKQIQRKRMINYFISAADDILRTEGKQALTARRVADKAGYNVATLYNYFSNFNHLLLFTSIQCLNAYARDLAICIQDISEPVERYLKVWECFSAHSYNNPDKFHDIFFGEFDAQTVNDSIRLFYEVFPEILSEDIKEFVPMLKESNIFERDYLILQAIAKSTGKLSEQQVHEINEINCLLYQSLLYRQMLGTEQLAPEQTVQKTMRYIKKVLESYGVAIPKA